MRIIFALMVVLTGLFPAAIYTKSLIDILFSLMFAPKFGMKCSQISIFGWTLIHQNGKWHKSYKGYVVPLIQHNTTIDINRYQADKAEQRTRNFNILRITLLLTVSICFILLNLGNFRDLAHFPQIHPLKLFSLSFSVGMMYQSLSSLCILLYTYLVIMKGLGGYMDSLLERLRAGESFETLDIRPVDELSYPNATKTERMMYHNLYLMYLLATKQYSKMKPIIEEMTDYYRERAFILQDTPGYYLLVFYYSAFEPDEDMAEWFFDKVRCTLENDNDANAKRVLACYYLNIVKDYEKARQYTDEGLHTVDNYSIAGAERDLERRLLEELHTTLVSIGLPSTVLPS